MWRSLQVGWLKLLLALTAVLAAAPAAGAGVTRVSIGNSQWHLNGEVTYRGAKAEGLLMNVRMVNAVFEDRKRPDVDAQAETDVFVRPI